MKVNDIKIKRVEKWITVNVSYCKKSIDFSFITIDGKVVGDYQSNMATSYLRYFDKVSERTHKSHFNFIKKYIETMIPTNNK